MFDCFLNSADFAEVISYVPHGQAAKDIKAIVMRLRLKPNDENQGRTLQHQAEIWIANDATKGVTSVDKKDDRVVLKDFEETTNEARIIEVLHKDDEAWHLLVEW